MGSMDNGPFNFKQIFVEFKKEGLAGFVKNRTVCLVRWFDQRFERFNAGSTTKRFLEMD